MLGKFIERYISNGPEFVPGEECRTSDTCKDMGVCQAAMLVRRPIRLYVSGKKSGASEKRLEELRAQIKSIKEREDIICGSVELNEERDHADEVLGTKKKDTLFRKFLFKLSNFSGV